MAQLFLFTLETKKLKLPDRTKKIQSITSLCHFQKDFGFFKQNQKKVFVSVMIFFPECPNTKQKLYSEPDRKKLICTFREEDKVKLKCFLTLRDSNEEMVS